MYRVPVIGSLLAALLGCDLPTERVAPPIGTCTCQAPERGLLVGAGWFTLQPEGEITDKITGQTGTWTYNTGRREFLFSGKLDVERATYNIDTSELIFYLRLGVHRTHVEDGKLTCQRTGE